MLKRITIPEIKKHPWFLKNLPREISEREKANYKYTEPAEPAQAVDPALLAEMAMLESDEEEADAEDTY